MNSGTRRPKKIEWRYLTDRGSLIFTYLKYPINNRELIFLFASPKFLKPSKKMFGLYEFTTENGLSLKKLETILSGEAITILQREPNLPKEIRKNIEGL